MVGPETTSPHLCGPRCWVSDPTVVAVLRLPISVTALARLVKGLEATYGKGLTLGPSVDNRMPVHLPGDRTDW